MQRAHSRVTNSAFEKARNSHSFRSDESHSLWIQVFSKNTANVFGRYTRNRLANLS